MNFIIFSFSSYVAPEILRGDPYGVEVDIWSMGVICYVLLVGYPPFYDQDQRKLFRKIKAGLFSFHKDYWSNISPEAIDMIKKMLTVNQKKRWSAKQLLKHPWITIGDEALEIKDLSHSVEALAKYTAARRYKKGANAVTAINRLKNMVKVTKANEKGVDDDAKSIDAISNVGNEVEPEEEDEILYHRKGPRTRVSMQALQELNRLPDTMDEDEIATANIPAIELL